MEILRYNRNQKEEWDAFVENARNTSFLFQRDFMEYHSDRFIDHSLMAYRKGKLIAVLPANISDSTLHTHQGLTYGGWVLAPKGLDTTEIFEIWRHWLKYCQREEIEKIVYKPLPYIYAEMPSEEDRYMLFLSGANLVSTNISSAIDMESNPGFDKLQRRHLKKAIEEVEIGIITTEGMEEFYRMLENCLRERHGERPVHTVTELNYLIEKFPDNIKIYGSYSKLNEELLAGVCVFETGMTAHCQYIATTKQGREINALAPLFAQLTDHYEEYGFRYFDFGISNEKDGLLLNKGLNRQKTSYGGSGVAYTRYEINVSDALKSLPTVLWPRE